MNMLMFNNNIIIKFLHNLKAITITRRNNIWDYVSEWCLIYTLDINMYILK